MAIATVTCESKITIPKEVLERFRITSGMQLIFRENARGALEITPRNVTMEETFRWADEHLISPSKGHSPWKSMTSRWPAPWRQIPSVTTPKRNSWCQQTA